MVRTVHRLVVGLSLLGCGVLGPQTAGRAAPDASNPIQITFGQSEAPLYGPWRFSVGDSPVDAKTGRPLWAEPDFDDSKWENVDLTPKGDIDAVTAHFGMVPGWTARGHTGYSGYAWYRIRVQARSQAGHSLALAGPASVDEAYQLRRLYRQSSSGLLDTARAVPPPRAFVVVGWSAGTRLSGLDGAVYAR
jgi:hypothetical protein